MKSIWATTIWLYLGDVLFVSFVVWGSITCAIWATKLLNRELKMNLTYPQLRTFATFQVAWLLLSLILFKFVILQGGPHFTHLVGTGSHGSVQFSTIGELFAAVVTLVGLGRWVRFLARHVVTWHREDIYDRN